jgi:hypothetical protein
VSDVDRDLRTLLRERADDVRPGPRMPAELRRRSHRRRALTAATAGIVTVALIVGGVAVTRLALRSVAGPAPAVTPGAGSATDAFPFIYPPTQEELEVTQEQVAQGSMPMWTEPEGVAVLFAVNVMGWDMEDVEVSVQGMTATISDQTLPEGFRLREGLPTVLHLSEVPGSDPRIFAVLAAVAETIEVEPIGPDEEFGSRRRLAFQGRVPSMLVPAMGEVALTVNNEEGARVSADLEPDGSFQLSLHSPVTVGPNTLISFVLEDESGNVLALTSSRVATPIAAGSETGASEPQLAVPPRVAETREAILAAAQARDFEALRSLIPEEGFTFSYGGETDPIRYWKRLESEGHQPVIGDILPAVLGTEPGYRRGVFVWPAQALEEPARWDEADIEALSAIHAQEDIRAFQDAGLYYGWRVGIDRDGIWVFFVAGD